MTSGAPFALFQRMALPDLQLQQLSDLTLFLSCRICQRPSQTTAVRWRIPPRTCDLEHDLAPLQAASLSRSLCSFTILCDTKNSVLLSLLFQSLPCSVCLSTTEYTVNLVRHILCSVLRSANWFSSQPTDTTNVLLPPL